MDKKSISYWKLFISAFFLSAFTFGGGYVIVPLMRKRFVDDYGWIEEGEMLNLIAISQSAPGPIAINTSILVGYRLLGVPGAFVTILGTVLPPFVIISVVTLFYEAFKENAAVGAVLKGMSAGVAAVIADVIVKMGKNIISGKDAFGILLMCFSFLAVFLFGIDVKIIIPACGALGLILSIFRRTKRRGDDAA